MVPPLQAGTCRVVLLAGLVAMLLPLALMCFFDDDKTLGLLSESLQCVLAKPPQTHSSIAQAADFVVAPWLTIPLSHRQRPCQLTSTQLGPQCALSSGLV